MTGSDSESDSDHFESAEESLDEEEKTQIKTRSKKNSNKSESEVAEPVVSQNDRVRETLPAEDVSHNSRTYRKRPERVKRATRIPSPKATTRARKKSGEKVFRTDVADVFFQDITTNLSKNLNKGLHTLQQTSSNVKGLILSSLPTSSTLEDGGFVYDDNLNNFQECDVNDESNLTLHGEKVKTKDQVTELPKSVRSENKKIKDESKVQDKDVKLIHQNENLIEPAEALEEPTSQLNNPEVNQTILECNELISEEVESNVEQTSPCSEQSNISTDDVGDDYLETDADKADNAENAENVKESCVEDQVVEALKITDAKSESALENKVNPCQSPEHSFSNTSLKIDEPLSEELRQVEDSCTTETLTEVTPSSQINDGSSTKPSSTGPQSFSVLEVAEEKNKDEIEDAEIDSNENGDVNEESDGSFTDNENFNKFEEKNLDFKMIATEMKIDKETVKKNMRDKAEFLESRTFQTDFDVMETTEKSNEDNDGWDDFDFSDNEIEDVKSENTNKSVNLEKSKNVLDFTAEQQSSSKKSDSVKTKTNLKTETQNSSTKTSSIKDVGAIKKVPTKEAEDLRNAEQENEPLQETNEGWDWDTWDDDTDFMEEKNGKSLQSVIKGNEKQENKFEDRSAWSGLDTLSQKIEQKQGNWNIGSWGVNMLLNKATAVTQGISNVLEAGLGVPDPETFARMQKEEERHLQHKVEKVETSDRQEEEMPKKNSLTSVNLFPVSGITDLVAGVTSKIVEHTKIQEIGSKVITGGLDTLETFGKKTMEVLQEGDPGLRNKRALLLGDKKPVLSQILREAREKADREVKQAEEKAYAKKCHFETLFDDFQGMVHLEALEMLSRQYELKLEQIKNGMNSEELEDLEGVLEEVEQLCALDDLDLNSSMLDFKTSLQMAVEPLKDEISIGQIIQIHDTVHKWLQTSSELNPSLTTLHQKAVATVAELTAATVHQFHKAGELLSIKECRKTVEEVEALSKLTNILCLEINKICDSFVSMFAEKSNKKPDSANAITEKVTIMKNNANSYIKQAFNLLIPVLQAGAAL